MNVSDWSGSPTNPALSFVLTIMGCVSLAVILLAILAAFNRSCRKVLKSMNRHFWRRLKAALRWAFVHSPVANFRHNSSEADMEHGMLSSTRPTTSSRTVVELEKENGWIAQSESLDVGDEVWAKSNTN